MSKHEDDMDRTTRRFQIITCTGLFVACTLLLNLDVIAFLIVRLFR